MKSPSLGHLCLLLAGWERVRNCPPAALYGEVDSLPGFHVPNLWPFKELAYR